MSMTRKVIYFGALVLFLWIVAGQLFPGTFSSDPHKQDLKVAKKVVELAEKGEAMVQNSVDSVASRIDEKRGEGRASQANKVNERGEPVLYEGEVWDEKNQRFLAQQVVEVSMKFPLLVRQKIWEPSDQHPSGRLYVGENTFVADHVMVRVKSGHSEAYVARVVRSEGMEIRKRLNNEDLYLIEFPVVGFDSWNKAVERLRELNIVQSIAPDLLGGIPQ